LAVKKRAKAAKVSVEPALSKAQPALHPTVLVRIRDLKPHPKNYRDHPEDQRRHIEESITEHGVYRNVVVAKDNTILAGHGVIATALEMGMETIPVVRLPIGPDDPHALKIIAGDNEIGKLSIVDDRALSELLKSIKDVDIKGLLGTGFDEMMLANLAFVTRAEGEIKDLNAAAEWAAAGMPAYVPTGLPTGQFRLLLSFQTDEERKRYVEKAGIIIHKMLKEVWTAPWPPRPRDDINALRFKEKEGAKPPVQKRAPKKAPKKAK
jgi:hypothetical protein